MDKEILIINNDSVFFPKLVKIIDNFGFIPIPIHFTELFKPTTYNTYSGIVLSGGPHDTHDNAEMDSERKIIRDVRIPVLGVCFGMQLLAMMYGGKIKQLPKKDAGTKMYEVISLEQNGLLCGLPSKFLVAGSNEFVIESVGSELVVIGKSRFGIEIIRHKKRQIYGVQFHPEIYATKTDGLKVLENFIKGLR